jgi:hypothetical protein
MPRRTDIGKLIASLPGVHQEVVQAGREIRRAAQSLAKGHGTLPATIHLEYPNKYDVDVVMEHKAALSIEEGHEDKVFDSGWVPGLHIMRDAARM